MMRFVQHVDRGQSTPLPERPDVWSDENNPLRAIDFVVDERN